MREVSDGTLPVIAKRVARKIMASMLKWFPGEVICRHAVSRLAVEAYKITDDDYGEKEAIEWASGFEFAPDLGIRDGNLLKEACGDLEVVVREKQALMADERTRLSLGSIKDMVPLDDPDRQRLIELVQGIQIVTDEDFEANGSPPPLRAKYLRMAPAVNKLMQQLYDSGKVMIIPTRMALQIEGIHFLYTLGDQERKSVGPTNR